MSSINQIVSELAHSVQQPDSIPVRRSFKLAIIHARNEVIRKTYDNHAVTEKVLQQRVKLSLIDVPDGDIYTTKLEGLGDIKRTNSKVPRATRLNNGIPFHSIRTIGTKNPIEIPYVKEAAAKYYKWLPGMANIPTYDYINEYLYINLFNCTGFKNIQSIIVESVFEYPQLIQTETSDGGILSIDDISDDDEFLVPEDMIGTIKKMALEAFNANVVRNTDEIPPANLVK